VFLSINGYGKGESGSIRRLGIRNELGIMNKELC